MNLKIVEVPTIKVPIVRSPGFAKKDLSTHKLDIVGLCQYGCAYCSSNSGNYQRINRGKFAAMTEAATGIRSLPADDPNLMFIWKDIEPQIETQLREKKADWGAGETLIFSMQTDGFSPKMVSEGVTERVLRQVLARTSFRIRILTKNPIVGSKKWIQFFAAYPGRFVVGLSVGTIDDQWARAVERGVPAPSARLRALAKLQAAGIPTYGMLCPVFPHMLLGDHLKRLLDAISPVATETIWAEPYNDRANWKTVKGCLVENSIDHDFLGDVYERGNGDRWSSYAADLYERIHAQAITGGWNDKLRYLLYESGIVAADAKRFAGLDGVLLQSPPGDDGRSKNPHIAALQS